MLLCNLDTLEGKLEFFRIHRAPPFSGFSSSIFTRLLCLVSLGVSRDNEMKLMTSF